MDNRKTINSRAGFKRMKTGKPSIDSVEEGVVELWFVDNAGLRLVVKYNNKLYYGNLTSSL